MSLLTAADVRRGGLRALSALLKLTTGISGGGPAGPSFISFSHSSALTTVPKPAGVASGDLLIIIASENPAATFSTPTGFTLMPNCAVNNAATENNAWYRLADGSEAADFTYTNNATATGAVCLCYRNPDPVTPIASSAAAANGGGAQNATCPDATGPGIHVIGATFQSLTSDIAAPTGYTERGENVGNYKAWAGDKTVGAGLTGAQTVVGPQWGAGFSIMLTVPA